jgi:hypothetical protein
VERLTIDNLKVMRDNPSNLWFWLLAMIAILGALFLLETILHVEVPM